MEYLATLYDNESIVMEPGTPEWDAAMPAYAAFEENHGDKIRGGEALHPSTTGFKVRPEVGLVTDGPFTETTEVVGGYYLFEAASLDDALAIARDIPALADPTTAIEVRPVVMTWAPETLVGPQPGDVRYLAMICGPESAADIPDTPEWEAGAAEHGRFVEKHADALLSGVAVKSLSSATTLRKKADEVQVSDGTVAGGAPIAGGLYVIRAQSRDDAVAVARDIPTNGPDNWIDIRPLVDFDEG